jgi:hypothetical protein
MAAVILKTPWTAGFQLQVTFPPKVEIPIHAGILLPFARNVTLPA